MKNKKVAYTAALLANYRLKLRDYNEQVADLALQVHVYVLQVRDYRL